jgi:hypothetical protein
MVASVVSDSLIQKEIWADTVVQHVTLQSQILVWRKFKVFVIHLNYTPKYSDSLHNYFLIVKMEH